MICFISVTNANANAHTPYQFQLNLAYISLSSPRLFRSDPMLRNLCIKYTDGLSVEKNSLSLSLSFYNHARNVFDDLCRFYIRSFVVCVSRILFRTNLTFRSVWSCIHYILNINILVICGALYSTPWLSPSTAVIMK